MGSATGASGLWGVRRGQKRGDLEGVGLQEGGTEHGGVADEVAERAGRVGTRLVLLVAQQLY